MASPAPNATVVSNPQLVEYGKFVQLVGDSRFPAVSVLDLEYPDTTAAFPGNSAAHPLSSYSVYPKYAVITYESNMLGSGGFVYLSAGGYATGNFNAILPLTTTILAGMTAQYTQNNILAGVSLPAGVRIDAPFTAVSASGTASAILYYAD